MKTPMIAAVAALFATAALPTFAFADGHLPDLEGREVVIVTENAYPPLQFMDSDGNAVGWEYDAMAEVAERLNITIVYENISWDAMIPAVSEGQFDMGMTGITIREDRAEVVDFSDSYMTSEMAMLVRGDEDRFSDAASFAADADLLVAAQRRSMSRSMTCLTRMRPTHAFNCSKPLARALRHCAMATLIWC